MNIGDFEKSVANLMDMNETRLGKLTTFPDEARYNQKKFFFQGAFDIK